MPESCEGDEWTPHRGLELGTDPGPSVRRKRVQSTLGKNCSVSLILNKWIGKKQMINYFTFKYTFNVLFMDPVSCRVCLQRPVPVKRRTNE